jgi:hypothetical protein
MTSEGRVKAGVLRYLERRGFYCWNNPTGAVQVRPGRWLHFGKKGSSDILGCLPGGRFLAVETKARRGRLAPEQQEFLDRIRGMGGLALVAHNWKEVDRALRDAGYNNDTPLFTAKDY